jgi:Domain of unknown function (DUF6968)
VNLNLEFDQAIAERTIEAREGRNIVVTLGMPRVEDKIGGWVCPYRIEGLPGEPNYRMFGGGTDSVHAIIAALANLGAYLNYRWKDELGLNFCDADHLGLLDAQQPPLINWSPNNGG